MGLGHPTKTWIGGGVGQRHIVCLWGRAARCLCYVYNLLRPCWNQPEWCVCRIFSILASTMLVYLLVSAQRL